jgi:hypothetical protein
MFCPKCGQRNEGDYKFCRGCGENLEAIAKAIERRWLKLFYRTLDGYIRRQNLKLTNSARSFRIVGWLYLISIAMSLMSGLFGDSNDWWVWASFMLLVLLANFWDYVSFNGFRPLVRETTGGHRNLQARPIRPLRRPRRLRRMNWNWRRRSALVNLRRAVLSH